VKDEGRTYKVTAEIVIRVKGKVAAKKAATHLQEMMPLARVSYGPEIVTMEEAFGEAGQ